MKILIRQLVLLSVVFLCISFTVNAQDKAYVRSVLDSLCAPSFDGRGYVNRGDRHAAEFIVSELRKTSAEAISDSWYQGFKINVNTFPSALEISVDGKPLIPYSDFVIGGASASASGTFKVVWLNDAILKNKKDSLAFIKRNLKGKLVLLDTNYTPQRFEKLWQAAGVIITEKGKPLYDFSSAQTRPSGVYASVSREKIPTSCKTIRINAEGKYLENYQTQNVAAKIVGRKYPDSCIVFTAHYDHLGRMGAATYFPGANDNASGCAMLLDLARYYSLPENTPDCSVVFLFFVGEELGLVGSKYFSENPMFPLSTIKFLINLDMVSTGSDGIKVVNGAVLSKPFTLLTDINKENNLLKVVSPRGEAANSDHYWFYKKGVPSFFIYTLGSEWKEYHSPQDTPAGLPLTKYDELFKLVTLFVKQID